MPERYLVTYLRDHHALATGEFKLIERLRSENKGNHWGEAMDDLLAPVKDDCAAFSDLLHTLGTRPSTTKGVLARLAERLGRIKTNDRLFRYSPLSRVEEIEGLLIGAEARRAAWSTVDRLLWDDPRVHGRDFAVRERRAGAQIEKLHRLHRDAVEAMLEKVT